MGTGGKASTKAEDEGSGGYSSSLVQRRFLPPAEGGSLPGISPIKSRGAAMKESLDPQGGPPYHARDREGGRTCP
jgi:hypothetical protein